MSRKGPDLVDFDLQDLCHDPKNDKKQGIDIIKCSFSVYSSGFVWKVGQ